jgi:1-deoxy-D-xylulose-5-phosphate synthase
MICANLDEAQLPQLAQELRNFIIDVVSVKEGHLVLV